MPSEFFRMLSAVKERYRWRLDSAGRIRTVGGEDCPLITVCAEVYRKRFDHKDYLLAADRIGLSVDFANDLAVAADNTAAWRDRPEVQAIRRRLMEELGLVVEQQEASK